MVYYKESSVIEPFLREAGVPEVGFEVEGLELLAWDLSRELRGVSTRTDDLPGQRLQALIR